MAQSKFAGLGNRYRNDYEGAYSELQEELEQQAKRRRKQTRFVPFYTLLARFTHENRNSESPGDKRLAELRRVLDLFKWTRSPDQVKFHEDFILLCLQHIYKEDFEPNRQRLMKAFGVDGFKVASLVITPRRWGKTTSVAMFIAAMLVVCLSLVIATFAPGQRAATGLKSKVLQKLHELPEYYHARIRPDSKELLRVISPEALDSNGEITDSIQKIISAKKFNSLYAFPANNEGTKRFYSPVLLA
jgi:hypothetical protein